MSQHLNSMACIFKLYLYTILNPTQKVTLSTKICLHKWQRTIKWTPYSLRNKHPVRTKGNQSHQQLFQRGNYQQPTTVNKITNNKISTTKLSVQKNPKQTVQRKNISKTRRHPLDKKRIQTRCKICQSIHH